jgi:hypothetical protein
MAVKEIIKSGGDYIAPDYICYTTDVKPTVGVQDGSTLIEVNFATKAKIYYIFFDGAWY